MKYTNVPFYIRNYLTNISIKNRYIYFELPKNACSTIKRTLQYFENGKLNNKTPHDKKQSPLKSLSDLNKNADFNEYFKFTFIRNPYFRVLSCFLEKFRPGDNRYASYYNKLGLNQNNYQKNNISFEHFLSLLSENNNIYKDIHWAPQSFLLPQNIKLDYLGRFENFSEEFKFLIKILFPYPPPEIKTEIYSYAIHKTNSENFKDQFLNKENMRKIYNLYESDFCLFYKEL